MEKITANYIIKRNDYKQNQPKSNLYAKLNNSYDSISFTSKAPVSRKKISEMKKKFAAFALALSTLTGCTPKNQTNIVTTATTQPTSTADTKAANATVVKPNTTNSAPTEKLEQPSGVLINKYQAREDNNISSLTIDLTGSYDSTQFGPGTSVAFNNDETMAEFIEENYGSDIQDGEILAAARAIVDHNRQLLDAINSKALARQVMTDIEGANLGSEEENVNKLANSLLAGTSFEQIQKDSLYASLNSQAKEALKQIAQKVYAKGYENGYEQYQEDVDTKYIVGEDIFGADYSNVEATSLFAPKLVTLQRNDDAKATVSSSTIGFNPMEDYIELDFNSCKSDEEKIELLTNAIVENYNLPNATNFAMSGILSGIALKDENNEIFDKTNENPSTMIATMVDYANKHDNKITLATPYVNETVLADEDMTDSQIREILTEEKDSLDDITYLHATKVLVGLKDLEQNENGETPALSLLQYIEYGSSTLKDAVEEARKSGDSETIESTEALARSALEQLFSNEPDLFGDWTDGKSNSEVLNSDISNFVSKAPNGKVVLEDVKYIIANKPAVQITPAQTPVVPDEKPTNTPTNPTTPPTNPPTNPPTDTPTNPTVPPTVPPTDPPTVPPTDPPTTPPTDCPPNPTVDPDNPDIPDNPDDPKPDPSKNPNPMPTLPSPDPVPTKPGIDINDDDLDFKPTKVPIPDPTPWPSDEPPAPTAAPTDAPCPSNPTVNVGDSDLNFKDDTKPTEAPAAPTEAPATPTAAPSIPDGATKDDTNVKGDVNDSNLSFKDDTASAPTNAPAATEAPKQDCGNVPTVGANDSDASFTSTQQTQASAKAIADAYEDDD